MCLHEGYHFQLLYSLKILSPLMLVHVKATWQFNKSPQLRIRSNVYQSVMEELQWHDEGSKPQILRPVNHCHERSHYTAVWYTCALWLSHFNFTFMEIASLKYYMGDMIFQDHNWQKSGLFQHQCPILELFRDWKIKTWISGLFRTCCNPVLQISFSSAYPLLICWTTRRTQWMVIHVSLLSSSSEYSRKQANKHAHKSRAIMANYDSQIQLKELHMFNSFKAIPSIVIN